MGAVRMGAGMPARRRRPWMAVGRLSVMTAVVLLAGCVAERHPQTPAAKAGEVWVVGIGYPEGEWASCFEDDSVAESLMTADLPASSATAAFTPQASAKDVRHALDCLDHSLTGGDVSVTVTAQAG